MHRISIVRRIESEWYNDMQQTSDATAAYASPENIEDKKNK